MVFVIHVINELLVIVVGWSVLFFFFQQRLDFLFQGDIAHVAGNDLSFFVCKNVRGEGAYAQLGKDGRLPHEAVANVGPGDAVVLKEVLTFGRTGVKANGDDGYFAWMIFLQSGQLAKNVLRVETPRCPYGNDIGFGIEILLRDGISFRVDGLKGWQLAVGVMILQTFQQRVETRQLRVLWLGLV